MVYGSVNLGTRLMRRTSAGSIPISSVYRSTMRSIATAASGRPAPRYAVVLTLFVTVVVAVKPTLVISYVPVSHAVRHPGQDRADDRVRPGVLEHVELVGGDAAVPCPAELGVLDLAPALRHRHHVLGTGLGPLHGPAELPGVPAEAQLLGIGAGLGAEPAAHVGHHHPDVAVLEAEDRGEEVAGWMGALARRVVGEATVLRPERGAGPGLDGRGGEALVDDALLHHDLAPAEVGLVLRHDAAQDVAADLREEDDLVGGGGLDVDDRRQAS